MRQRHWPAGVVPFIYTVGGWGFVFSADWLVQTAGDGVWKGGGGRRWVGLVLAHGQLGARSFRHTTAAEGRDAAAVAAREDRGVGDQAGRLALGR